MSGNKAKTTAKFVVPFVILIGALLGAKTLVALKPAPEKKENQHIAPLVRVQAVTLQDVQFTVEGQGMVQPRKQSRIIPEITGMVIDVAENFAEGAFFEKGDVLIKIDSFDYQQAVIGAEAGLARAQLALARTEAESKLAREEWQQLGQGEADPLTLYKPQLVEARANVSAAESQLARAKRNLERTTIRAPYSGRILSKMVDVGQLANMGAPLAEIYAVDAAEIPLPIADHDLAFMDVPFGYRDGGDTFQPHVTISADFAGKTHTWRGRIVRSKGEIDPRTRMLNLIAEVRDPYALTAEGKPPLSYGMYVHAAIEGKTYTDLAVIPRSAIWRNNTVLIVDAEDRIRFRDLDVVRGDEDVIYAGNGLSNGDRIVLSRLEAVTDGMQVRIIGDQKDEQTEAAQ